MDPITVIVAALATGAAAGLKPTVEQAIKDAYAALKSLVLGRYKGAASSLDQLEQAPGSKARRAVVEEDLRTTEAPRDVELLRAAQALLGALEQSAPEAARSIGVDLQDLKAQSVKLANILAQGAGSATGVRIKGADVAGDLTITGVSAVGGPGLAGAVRPSVQPPKIRLLFLAANPSDTTRLRLDEEVRSIDESLRLSRFRDVFELEQAQAVRVGDLHGLLMRYEPQLVHFSGHGSAAGEILLEDAAGNAQGVSPQALGAAFSLLKGNIRGVVLNACFSQRQAEAIAEHIDFVVGMSTAIGDQAAIDFATAFYQALAYGRDVKTAFELGRNQIDLKGLGEEDTPQLLAPHADCSQVVFAGQ